MNNNRSSLLIFAVIWLAGILLMKQFGIFGQQQAVQLVKPEVMMAQAQKAEKEAGNDQTKLNDAVKAYQDVAGKNKSTEYAAQARLEIAIIQETKLIQQPGFWANWFGIGRPQPGDKQEQAAVLTYKALLKDFSPEKSESAKVAQARLSALEVKIDRANSHATLYKIIDALVNLTGHNPKWSYVFALLIITIVFKVITTPLSHLQFKYMKEMQKIQPLMKQLQEKYKDNQKELGEKMMALYKEHGVNPFSSCLPMLIQLPVLMILFKMVRLYEFQFAQGQFLWIGSSLSHKLPAYFSILGYKLPLIASSLAMPDLALLVIYTISMFISQKMTVVDPTQAEQQKMMMYMMPIMMAFIFASFASAFMLYWLLFNIISTAQQYYILRPTHALATIPPTAQAVPADGPGAVISKPAPKKIKRRKK